MFFMVLFSVVAPNHFDADPDPACHFDPNPACHFDPNPACHFDPDPTFHFDADPDPSFQVKAQNLEKVLKEAQNSYILAFPES
jgi:hypothetical protein